jgi:hypothetical protein
MRTPNLAISSAVFVAEYSNFRPSAMAVCHSWRM